MASLMVQMVKNPPVRQEILIQSLGQEDHLEKGMPYPLQYSCLKNSMDRGAWLTIVHWGHEESNMTD